MDLVSLHSTTSLLWQARSPCLAHDVNSTLAELVSTNLLHVSTQGRQLHMTLLNAG